MKKPMRIACGTDITIISRLRSAVEKSADTFLEKIFTSEELAYCSRKSDCGYYASLAARFAAKEAVAKALGTGIGPKGVSFKDIEICRHESGEPYVSFHNKTKEYFLELGGVSVSISLSHDGDQAIAFCVMQFL